MEAWSQLIAAADFEQIEAVFEANAAVAPRVCWAPAIAQIQPDSLRALLRYWRALQPQSELPNGAGLDLHELDFIRGHEALVEVIGAGANFRYRRSSAVMTALVGLEATGMMISDLPLPHFQLEGMLAFYRAAYRRREPAYVERAPAGPLFASQALVLPMADDAGDVGAFLVGIVPTGSNGLPLQMQASI